MTAIKCIKKSFYLEFITPDELLKDIQLHNLNKPSGPENNPIKVIKIVGIFIAPYLSKIVNENYNSGIFPKSLKKDKVVPIHKKGVKNIASNYRSISMLLPVSNIFEKLIYKRLEKIFNKHDFYLAINLDFEKVIQLHWQP